MMPVRYKLVSITGALLLAFGLACDFNPTGPFEDFDGLGSRVSGTFSSEGGSGSTLRAAPQTTYDGMTVQVKQGPSIETSVKSNGTFTLTGIPERDITLVFRSNGERIGAFPLRDVLPNQEIRVVVELTDSGRVRLLEQDRDDVGLGGCARGAGFWCQNQNGQNPNLAPSRFDQLAVEAAGRLTGVDGLGSAAEIRTAVCDTSDQLLRHLAVLALNLAAETVSEGTVLEGEEFGTVGEAFDRAVAVASDPNARRSERSAIQDVLERINENRNTVTDCSPIDDDDDDVDDVEDEPDDDDDTPPTGASCSNVEIPRGAFPPPGECKIWDPRLPAGQQGPPGNCSELCGRKPAGTCVIDSNGNVVC